MTGLPTLSGDHWEAGTRPPNSQAEIRSRNCFWLAIPTPAAGKFSRGGRNTPGEWERRSGLRLHFVYRRTGPSLLVAEGWLKAKGSAMASRSKIGRGVTTVLIFLLVPQVTLPTGRSARRWSCCASFCVSTEPTSRRAGPKNTTS